MVGFLEGFTSLITKNISDIVLMNGCIHRYILASKILEDERKNILLSAIKNIPIIFKNSIHLKMFTICRKTWTGIS